MKTFTSTLIALFSALCAVAQTAGGSIEGTVTDGSRKSIEAASISLHRAADSALVKLSVATAGGAYRFDGIPAGRYLVSVTAVGHAQAWSAPLTLVQGSDKLTVPGIELQPVAKTMAGVTVTSRRPLVEQKADRTVINVDASPTNAGATALEVLEKSPGITIDKDGNISFKGKQGIQVLVDGRPSYLSGAELVAYLRSLPATAIDQLELMSNPPARYDAAGKAGLINIRTKKNRAKGFNGSLSLAGTTGLRNRANNSLNLNYRNGKWNLFSNLNHSHYERFQNLDIQRTFRNAGAVTALFEQETRQRGNNDYLGGKFGVDYYLSKRSTLGMVVTFGSNNEKGSSVSRSQLKNATGSLDSVVTAESLSNNRWRNGAVNLNFRQQFDSSGRELTADADYIHYNTGADQYFYNNSESATGVKGPDRLLRGDLPVSISIYSVKSDYTHPLKAGAKIEAGVKGSYVRTENAANYFNVFGGNQVVDPDKTNQFRYEERIAATYMNWNRQFKKWNLQAGLRFEETIYNGLQYGNPDKTAHPDSSFRNQYGSLFPTLFASYAANDKNSFTFSYGRRIERPSYQNLNPFLFYIDNYTYEQGNPFMRPEFAHNFEIGHSFRNRLNTSINYSMARDVMNEIFGQAPVSTGGGYATVIRNGNIGRREQLAISVNAQLPLRKWWNMTVFSNYTYSHYHGALNGGVGSIDIRSGVWIANLQNQLQLGKGWSGELSSWFRSAGKDGQIQVYSLWDASAGISKSIFDNKGSLRLNVRDIFYSNRVAGRIDFQDTEAHFQQRRDTRNVTLSFTWRFGKPLKDAAPRRNTGAASDEMNRVKGAN
ncbi:TonB-dependent receptor domain-containing protein [Flaviaesturariibacter terrae]